MNRIDVINSLVSRLGYRRYLEIGCHNDDSFRAVRASHKVGVDPASGGTLRMRSDEYFASYADEFDVIFIDGDHHHAQVRRDVDNALRRLAPSGTIVMHDCLPPDREHEGLHRCGTAWRAFLSTRERPDIDSFVCDFDYGVGIVRRGSNPLLIYSGKTMEALSYDDLLRNRTAWMRPTSFHGLLTRIDCWRARDRSK